MLIRFLGTSAGWPLPRLGCNCRICRSKDPKDNRRRPALLIDGKVLIDAGPDIYHELIDQNPEKIEAVLITHDHWDHTYGLSDLTRIYGKKKKIVLISTEKVLKSIKRRQPYLTKFNLRPIKPLNPVEIFGIKVQLFPVFHSKSVPTYGISLLPTNQTSRLQPAIVYIPDYKTIPPKSLKKLKNTELIVLDGSTFSKMSTHATIDEGIAIAKKVKAQKVYFTHIGHKTGTQKELTEYVQKNGGKNFHIAYDGLGIKLT